MQVLMAMSGGVDSSVAAALLVEQGHDVVGVTMKLWGGTSDSGCCSIADVHDARRVADQLGIDHVVFNFTDEFDRLVVDPYVDAHRMGITPNPCIECNRHLKFAHLLDRADRLGFDAVATGHHCRTVRHDGVAYVARGADRRKDQSYVVHMIGDVDLERVLFPVGPMTKDAVRAHAARLGLRTATKADSQDVCFILATGGREQFLGARIALRPARVVDTDGHDVGTVEGVELLTVGQRRGLDLGGNPERRYVVGVDTESGIVTVGDAGALLGHEQRFTDLRWHRDAVAKVLVQSSAHGEVTPAAVVDGIVAFDAPTRRTAPGQAMVFYDLDDERVVGSATAA